MPRCLHGERRNLARCLVFAQHLLENSHGRRTGRVLLPAARRALRGSCRGRQAQAPTPDALLAREACYRALGEGFSHPALAARVDFQAWYASELRGLLACAGPLAVVACPGLGSCV